MANINVNFGDPAPIEFREYDEKHPEIDLDLEVRFAGNTAVSVYDRSLYGSDEEVASKVRETALSCLPELIRSWPEGRSFWNNTTRSVLEKHLDERLSELGISAKTDLFSLALTSESRELYDAAVKHMTEQKYFVDLISPYKKVIDGNEGQPVAGNPLIGGLHTLKYIPPSSNGVMSPDPILDPKRFEIKPNGGADAAPNDKYCRSCGAKRENEAKFCAECGARFA